MSEAKIILDACCGSRMFWFDKENPWTLFADIRDKDILLAIKLIRQYGNKERRTT